MPLRRKYVRGGAANSRSMRSTLFNSRITEFSSTMTSLSLQIGHFLLCALCDSVANLVFYRRDWMRSARVLKSLTPWIS